MYTWNSVSLVSLYDCFLIEEKTSLNSRLTELSDVVVVSEILCSPEIEKNSSP